MGNYNSAQQVDPAPQCCGVYPPANYASPTPTGAFSTMYAAQSSTSASYQPMQTSCPYFHSSQSQGGENYAWLTPYFGNLVKAEFNENNQGWIDYSQLHASSPGSAAHNWWIEHCQAINHNTNNLAADHIATFVTPATRTIVMRFTFDDGHVYRSDIDTAVFTYFFQLEQQYAQKLAGRITK
jgi:hypothetical protein